MHMAMGKLAMLQHPNQLQWIWHFCGHKLPNLDIAVICAAAGTSAPGTVARKEHALQHSRCRASV